MILTALYIVALLLVLLIACVCIIKCPRTPRFNTTNNYTHIHVKTGRKYRELTHATLEASLVDLVVYEGEDGDVWARPATEFNDKERFSIYV